MPVTHTYVSAAPAAPGKVDSVAWNAVHTIAVVNAEVDPAAGIVESKLSLNYPTHALVTLGTASGLSIVGQVLSLALASAVSTGALSSADWSTFNGKQNALGYTPVDVASISWIDLTDGGSTTLHTHAVPAGMGDVIDAGIIVGQLTKGVTDSKHITAAAIIPPASNILTLTNAAAATLALNITAAKTLTLTAADNYTLTIPATGTAALLETANVFTAKQTVQTTDGSTVLDVKFSKAFADLAIAVSNQDDNGWGSYTLRQVINNSAITGSTGSQKIRVSVETGAAVIGAVYIGQAATSGDAYDFEAAPTQVTFDGGSSGFTAAGGTKVSDDISFVYEAGKNLIIAIYASGATNYRGRATQAGWQSYYKSGNDTTTVNASGYTSWAGVTGIIRVEAGTPSLTSILTASAGSLATPSITASSVLATSATKELIAFTPMSNVGLLDTTQAWTGLNTFSAGLIVHPPTNNYEALILGNRTAGETFGAGMFAARYSSANSPFTAFMGYDNQTSRILYFGGGVWGHPDATETRFYSAPAYSETIDTGLLTLLQSTLNTQLNAYSVTGNAPINNLNLISYYTGGGAANGFGAALGIYAETATDGTVQQMAQIAAVWTTATNATRKAKLSLSVYDTAIRTGIEIHADGTLAQVGIGGVTPTARLHLPIGSTAANTAPLKFTQDATSLLTAVEAGAMEYYHNSLWFTNLAVRRTVVQAQSVVLVDQTIANTTTETTIFTQAHGANYLKVGKCEEITIQGIVSSLNTGVPAANALTIRVKYAGATLGTFTVLKSATANRNYETHVRITCRAIGSGTTTIQVHGNADVEGIATDPVFNGTSTGLDSTTAQATTVTVQWTDASASNTTTIQQGYALSIDNNA